jgi:hypothetical protein
VAISQGDLATVLGDLGEPAAARPLLERALSIVGPGNFGTSILPSRRPSCNARSKASRCCFAIVRTPI